MDVSVADAKNRLTELIRAVEQGESVVITRHGKPVAQLTAAPQTPAIQFGFYKGRMKLLPGWDEPIDEKEFLGE